MMPSIKGLIIILLLSIACMQNSFAVMQVPPEYTNFSSPEIYKVGTVEDEQFVMDDHIYDPKNHCLDIKSGDPMMFLDGHPASCVTAKLYNLRTGLTCDVWCE